MLRAVLIMFCLLTMGRPGCVSLRMHLTPFPDASPIDCIDERFRKVITLQLNGKQRWDQKIRILLDCCSAVLIDADHYRSLRIGPRRGVD